MRLARFAGLALAVVAAGPAAAEVVDLPVEVQLGADSHLVLELDGAEIRLTSRVSGLPALEARAAAGGEGGGLEIESSGGTLAVRRPAARNGAPRLRLDLALGPGRSVRVAGSDLEVKIDEPSPGDVESDPRGSRSTYRLELERSRAVLSGVYGPQLRLTESVAELSRTDGDSKLVLAGGSVRIEGHRGGLELDADGTEVELVDHVGVLTLELAGGSLEAVGGNGTVTGNAGRTLLSFDGRQGGGELTASASEIDVRESDGPFWKLAGRDLRATFEEVRGRIVAELEGGGLVGGRLTGSVELAAKAAATLELRDVTGHLALELTGGAQAWVSGVAGHLEAKVEDARLDADRVDGLTLTAKRAEVSARGVGRLDPSTAAASELTLELLQSRQEASLELSGASSARVRLPAPCAVRLAGEDAPQVEVEGCDLLGGTGGASARGRPRPTVVALTGSPDAEVEVEGEE